MSSAPHALDDDVRDLTLLATVSHELRGPLTSVLGWARLLRSGGSTDVTRGLEVIERSATLQLRLIDELLDLWRASNGRLTVERAHVDLNDVVSHVIQAVRPAAADRRVAVTASIPPTASPVRGDTLRLQQVVGNLVRNAVKFTPGGGRVTVTVGHLGRTIELDVEDTGIGIEPHLLPSIFEPFWQGDAASFSHRGLGLGLSIVRDLVELHGGTIQAFSAGINRGTRMTVRLPRAVDAAATVDLVDEASRESFPASDPPSWTLGYAAPTV